MSNGGAFQSPRIGSCFFSQRSKKFYLAAYFSYSLDKLFPFFNLIKSMLLGTHLLKINHVEKEIVIDRVEVAAEGVAAGLLIGSLDLIRIIDIGSGTVNYGTMINRKFNDKGRFTIATGMEATLTTDYIAFTRQVALRAIQGGWQAHDKVYLVGGGAYKVISYMTDYFPLAKLASNDVITANVQAFHMIARKLYG